MTLRARQSQLLMLLQRDSITVSGFHSEPESLDFAQWKVAELKDECRRLGLVTSRPKKELVAILTQYYAKKDKDMSRSKVAAASTIPIIEITDSDAESSSSSGFEVIEAVSRNNASMAMDSLVASTAQLDLNADADKPASLSTSSPIAEGAEEASQVSELYSPHANDMDEPMCYAIQKDTQLYQRILLMEPISLDEFLGVARRAGVLGDSASRNRASLRTWLDSQGICFYETDCMS